MKRLIVFAVLVVPIWVKAQTPSVRAVFKDKAVEAIQDADLIDTVAPEFEYTLERLQARRSVNATARAAVSDSERKIAFEISMYVEHSETCHITRSTISAVEFSKCLDEASSARSEALRLLGIDAKKFYPQF